MARLHHYLAPLYVIRHHVKVASYLFERHNLLGKLYSYLLDPIFMLLYSIDMTSYTIKIGKLSISHPTGVLLGGNGIISSGTVVITSGVKFVGKSPASLQYLSRHSTRDVFKIGHNVFIGVNTVLVGPLEICDNVIIATQSLVRSDITEPGTYAGIPVRKISECIDLSWFDH